MASDNPGPVLLGVDDPLHLKLLDPQEAPAGLEQLQHALTGSGRGHRPPRGLPGTAKVLTPALHMRSRRA